MAPSRYYTNRISDFKICSCHAAWVNDPQLKWDYFVKVQVD